MVFDNVNKFNKPKVQEGFNNFIGRAIEDKT
jgi:hypothetical protein